MPHVGTGLHTLPPCGICCGGRNTASSNVHAARNNSRCGGTRCCMSWGSQYWGAGAIHCPFLCRVGWADGGGHGTLLHCSPCGAVCSRVAREGLEEEGLAWLLL